MDQEQEWYPCLENVFLDGSTRLFGFTVVKVSIQLL